MQSIHIKQTFSLVTPLIVVTWSFFLLPSYTANEKAQKKTIFEAANDYGSNYTIQHYFPYRIPCDEGNLVPRGRRGGGRAGSGDKTLGTRLVMRVMNIKNIIRCFCDNVQVTDLLLRAALAYEGRWTRDPTRNEREKIIYLFWNESKTILNFPLSILWRLKKTRKILHATKFKLNRNHCSTDSIV